MRAAPTLIGFRDFCASKPADKEYNFCWSRGCAVAQYLRSLGYIGDDAVVIEGVWRGSNNPVLFKAEDISCGPDVPDTFGALTARLNEHLSHSGVE